MRDVAYEYGLTQLVREPTFGDNLLDLVMSDLDNVVCSVMPKIAHHKGVLVKLKLPVPLSASIKRVV